MLDIDAAEEENESGMSMLRIVIALHALAIMAQAVLAGEFLGGALGPVVVHERLGWAVVGIAAVQIALSVFATPRGQGLLLVLSSVVVFLGESLQVGTGYGRFLGVHVPLGVFLFGAVLWQAVYVFRSSQPAS